MYMVNVNNINGRLDNRSIYVCQTTWDGQHFELKLFFCTTCSQMVNLALMGAGISICWGETDIGNAPEGQLFVLLIDGFSPSTLVNPQNVVR